MVSHVTISLFLVGVNSLLGTGKRGGITWSGQSRGQGKACNLLWLPSPQTCLNAGSHEPPLVLLCWVGLGKTCPKDIVL